jgi:uncharacterized membrane protein YkoI
MEDLMNDKPWRRIGLAAGLTVVAGAVAAGVIATVLPAAAAGTAGVTTAATAAPGATGDQSKPVRSDEKQLTGTDAEKARAAALAAVPGATVFRVETDADGAVYEAHLTKSDGTTATVKLNADFSVAGIQAGMGATKGQPPAR